MGKENEISHALQQREREQRSLCSIHLTLATGNDDSLDVGEIRLLSRKTFPSIFHCFDHQ